MQLTTQISKHLREVHFGGNWSWSNIKDNLEGVTWQQATTKVYSLNTIAELVYHINYYIVVSITVLREEPLDADDKYSFNCPPILSQEDWQNLVKKALSDAESLAILIEQLPDSKLEEIFIKEKYGNYHRNFWGLIEHTHYHLGQIALIKKMISTE